MLQLFQGRLNNEAILAASNLTEKKKILKRRQSVKKIFHKMSGMRIGRELNSYIPRWLLEKPGDYCEVLKNRDTYISIQDAQKVLNISRSTIIRLVKKENIEVKNKKFIRKSTLKKYTSPKQINTVIKIQEAAKLMGVGITTIYRLVKTNNIYVNNGHIQKGDLDLIMDKRGVSIKEAMIQMNLKKTQIYHVAKYANINISNGYITASEYNLLKKVTQSYLLYQCLAAKRIKMLS